MTAAAAQSAPGSDSRFGRKRALIIKSAAHVFGRKGFHATTLEEIAAELKVTKASLYYYFSTKEELLFEVHLLSMEDVLSRLERVRKTESSPVDQLQDAIMEHLKVLAGDYEGAFLLQQEYDLPENYRAQIIRLRDRYEQAMLEIVQEGVRQRVFRVKDARVTVRMMLGAINWFLRWYRAGGRLTVDEIAEAYVDSIFHGVLAPPTEAARRAIAAGRTPAARAAASVHAIDGKKAPSARSRKKAPPQA